MSDGLSNPSWTREAAIGAFDGEGPHAEIIKLLRSVGGRDQYLNVGYSHRGQSHWGRKAQIRLIDRLAKPLRKLSKLEPELLDVGCGRGGPAVRLHEKWGMDVTGVDISENNIEIARRRTRDLAIHKGLTFMRSDVVHLPFQSDSFSFALAIESLEYVPDKDQAFAEIRRVLRPKAAFAMAAILVDEEAVNGSAENLEIYRDFLKAWDFFELAGLESYETLLTDAGFTVNRVEVATARTLLPHAKRLSRLLRVWNIGLLYWASKRYIHRKYGADLDPIRDQLEASHRAIKAGLIGYGLFWTTAPSQ